MSVKVVMDDVHSREIEGMLKILKGHSAEE